MRAFTALAALAVAGLATQASAQSSRTMVGAHDPASVVSALEVGGYEAELGTDDQGDPKITTEFAGMVSYIYFYGCEDNTGCTSLMFTTGFDRREPWDAAGATSVNQQVRYASTWLDEEGDPWISWDMVTGREGIPIGVFSYALRQYSNTVDRVADLAFAEQRGE